MKLIMENFRTFINEEKSQQAIAFLDKALGEVHASGRPMPEEFDAITEDSLKEDLKIVNQLTPSYLRGILEKYKSEKSPEEIDISETTDPREIAVINSLLLFTAGSVATVRDPRTFDPEKGKSVSSPIHGHGYGKPKYVDRQRTADDSYSETYRERGGIPPYLLKPTKELYTIAKYVMIQFSLTKNKSGGTAKIYRGIALPEKVVEHLKEGNIFNNKAISSWTTDLEVARDFASTGGDYTSAYFIIDKPQYGTDISPMSAYQNEDEYVLGRKVKIINKKVEDLTDWGAGIRTYFTCEII